MIAPFEFATAARIVFGAGKVAELPAAVRSFGSRPMVVTGASGDRTASYVKGLPAGVDFRVPGEPTIELVRSGAALAKAQGCDVIVALGGGSAIDAAKAIAAIAANPGDVLRYLEVIGEAKALDVSPLPVIAVPTTAGTGSEVTRNAVLASVQQRVKASLRHPLMLPRVALIDPELTLSLPPAATAATGLDALTQLIEPYTSTRANPLTDALCAEGIPRAARSLAKACHFPENLEARTDMSLASLFGGLALANAGLGAVHGFAAPIGGMFPAAHGAVCAALLPHVVRANWRVLSQQGSPHRYDQVARWLTGAPSAVAEDGIAWLQDICRSLNIPSLRAYGITANDLNEIAQSAAKASSMKANPVSLSLSSLVEILHAALWP